MSRDNQYLLDILQAARLALEYVKDKSEGEFLVDTQCQDAVIRRFEMIGEASRRLSDETRISLPELAWEAMISMRNILIHEYDDVDLEIVWNATQIDLPPLIASLEKIVPPPEEEAAPDDTN